MTDAMEEFLFRVASNFGVPVSILLCLGYAVYRASYWLTPRIDKMIDRHITFVDTATAKLNNIEERQEDDGKYIRSIHRHLKEKKESA